MGNRLPVWSAVLLALVGVANLDRAAGAEPTGRAAVAGRQRVRAALAAAVADGTLTQKEQQSIYRGAERLLPAGELPMLRRTLDRLAAQYGPAAPMPRASAEGRPSGGQGGQEATQAGPVAHNSQDRAEAASFEEPAFVADELLPEEAPRPLQEEEAAAEDDESAGEEAAPTPSEEEHAVAEDDQPAGGPALAKPLPEKDTTGSDRTTVIFEDYYDVVAEGFTSFYVNGCGNSRLSDADISFFGTVDAFKGPLDLDGRNGNFGFGLAMNAGMPLAVRFGVGIQAGTGVVLADLHGTEFTGSTIRDQNFTTIGLFQNIPFMSGRLLKWGFAYDWLHDSYFADLVMGQWRLKFAYELDPCREVGIWATVPDKGDSALLGSPGAELTTERFRPVTQGNLYYRRCWENGTGTTTWLGIAGEPGQIVLGADARVPVNCQVALVGGFNCILPNLSGEGGRDEELWAVSVGIELKPRPGANRCQSAGSYAPLFPLANNASLGIRRY